jgi:hypothetical protein
MDKFILKERNYKKIDKKETDQYKFKELDYVAKDVREKDVREKDVRDVKEKDVRNVKEKVVKDPKYKKEIFLIKENGDNLLNNWIKTQKDPIVVFLSEFIPNTKISKELERFKPIIKTTPIISIDEYRKKKKIGEEGVTYLKKLKEKYGNIVLKVLWANLNF